MKNRISVLLLLSAFAAALFMFSCDPDPEVSPEGENPEDITVSVTGISLDYSEVALFSDGEHQLTAAIEPADAENTNITWSSSDTSIVTVSTAGLVTAAGGVGSAVVTATSEDGSFTAECDFFVHQFKIAEDADIDHYFGIAVAIDGDYALVGSSGDDVNGSRSGSVYVYSRNQGEENTWGFVKKITPEDPAAGEQFGCSIALDGDYAVIGAKYSHETEDYAGSAYVFNRNKGGDDNWGQVAKMVSPNPTLRGYFGICVDISGDYVVVGAGFEDVDGTDSGSAYLFYKNQDGYVDGWKYNKTLVSDDPSASDLFGVSVAIDGDYIAVGASRGDLATTTSNEGSAYVYFRNQGAVADSWALAKKIGADDGELNDRFSTVSLSGDDLLVGATSDDDGGDGAGAAYIFSRNYGGDDSWGQVTKIAAGDAAADANFGWPCILSGDYAVIGAPYATVNGEQWAGEAYVYYRNEGGTDKWGHIDTLIEITPAESNQFGCSMGISGGLAIVGGQYGDAGSYPLDDYGSVYLFSIY